MQQVTRADLGGTWPLTVDSANLMCEGGQQIQAVTVEVRGVRYAVNGSTASKAKDIRPIWADNPAVPGTKIPLAALLQRGADLCKLPVR